MRLPSLLGIMAMMYGAGCDSVSTGQPEEESGPPRLVRIMVQTGNPNASDLLDDTPVTCDDTHPCPDDFFGSTCQIPDGETTGTCQDPLAAAPVPSRPQQLRLVFSKLLDPAIEGVATDDSGNKMFTLAEGVVEIQDASGMVVPSTKFWDPTGSPDVSSLPGFEPFGPALVITPSVPLNVSSMYSIVLTQSKAVDKKGQGAVDKNGNAFETDPYMKTFTTEDLAIASTAPDVTMGGATIAPNDTLQVNFNADVSAVTATLMRGTTTIGVNAFVEMGSDPTMCTAQPTTWNIQPVTGRWSPGDYTLTIVSATDAGRGMVNTLGVTYMFSVAPPDDAMATAHVMAADCVTPDGGMQ